MSPRVPNTALPVVNGAATGVRVSQIPWIQEPLGLPPIQAGPDHPVHFAGGVGGGVGGAGAAMDMAMSSHGVHIGTRAAAGFTGLPPALRAPRVPSPRAT